MDIPIQRKAKNSKQVLISICAATLIVLAIVFQVYQAKPKLRRSSLSIETVQQGTFGFSVAAYGTFSAKDQKLFTSPSPATVEEIVAIPGTMVKKGDILLRLANSHLVEQLSVANTAVNNAVLGVKEANLNAKVDMANGIAKVRELEGQLRLKTSQLDAVKPLAEQGIFSKFDLMKLEQEVDDLKSQLDTQKGNAALQKDIAESRIQVKEEALSQARGALDQAKNDLAGLEVRSTIDGLVQDVYVALGQSVALGDKLTQVSGRDKLIANLKVPQSRAADVAIGAKVRLHINGREFDGEVLRIDPKVRDGAVQVDVVPSTALPESVRASESVTADISAAVSNSTLYVEQNGQFLPYENREVFVLSGNELVKREVQFGSSSGKYVEVMSGMQAGDRAVMNVDPKLYENSPIKIPD